MSKYMLLLEMNLIPFVQHLDNELELQTKDWSVDYFLANQSECASVLENTDVLQEIPLLNDAPLHHFQDGQLVRFHGMLQDMHDPEFFYKTYEVEDKQTGEKSTKSGMYSDGARCENHQRIIFESKSNDTCERFTWIVVSTPGLNDWAKENSKVDAKSINFGEANTSECAKRSLDSETEPMDCSEPVKKKEKVSNGESSSGPSQVQKDSAPRLLSKDHLLNLPIPNQDGKTCIIKLYEDLPYKLNQVIDVVGFISLDPNLSQIHDAENMADDLENQTHHPPASLVPRLHAVKVFRSKNKFISDTQEIFSTAERVRGDLRLVLSQILFGDELAADYLICHLISSVYLRKDYLCLGAYTLNITNFPMQYTNFSKDLYEILKQLIPKSHFLDVTLDNLNEMSFLPKKDYECNRLTSGLLQLSDNTHLVLDESCLTAGQVTANGRSNHQTITDLINLQKLSYDFKFYKMEYDTDIPVLILSEYKSFIPCQHQIRIQPDPETVNVYPQVLEAAKLYLKDENRLNSIRSYISTLKTAKFELTDETSAIIQDDYVKLRQEDKNFSVDNLHSLMVLSRLMSLSHGMDKLTPEIWKRSLAMEMERKNRLKKP
ncbi:hypothetical protein QAD02_008717 [Eretmocerus hayati]|uniref:Uncharacterized protein n=1 Tax=Eretmocerus hayati TaxID=131215 RepID=A0ACC2N798_9HYME|nr:hypothetical protein QAD02_008717 [Eretmocerus hayati]